MPLPTLIRGKETFRLFADLKQCRHIYFAGCHDAGYGSVLTPYRGSDRFTLIKIALFHPDFEGLGFPIHELPTVFMATPLNTRLPGSSVNKRSSLPFKPGVNPKKVFVNYDSHCESQGICALSNNAGQQFNMPIPQLDSHDNSSYPFQLSMPIRERFPVYYCKFALEMCESRNVHSFE